MSTYTFTVGPVNATGQYGQNFAGKVVIEQTPNAQANVSSIKWAFYIWDTIGTSQYHYYNGNQVKVTIDGVVRLETANVGEVGLAGTSASNPLKLCEGTLSVGHSADGTRNLSVTADYYQPNASALQHITPTGTVTLETTRVAAQISSCPDLTLNGSNDHTVGWSTLQQGCYYRVQYKAGDNVLHTSPMLAGTGSAMTYTWADVPVDIAEYAPSASSLTVTVVLGTYSTTDVSSSVGTDSDTFTATFDTSSMGPVISDPVVTFSDKQGTSIVGGKTSASVAFEAEGQGGATISSSYALYATYNPNLGTYSDLNDTKVINSSPISLAEFPSTIFMSAESVYFVIKVVVTDSRGASSTKYSEVYTAYRLDNPYINMLSLARCDSLGNDDSSGTYFKAYCTYRLTSLNAQNEKYMSLSYFFVADEDDPTAWITPTIPDLAQYSGTVTLGPFELPEGEGAVAAKVFLWDAYTSENKASKEARLNGGEAFITAIMNDNLDKKSIAFGGMSEEEGTTQSFWPFIADDGIKAYKNKGLSGQFSVETDGEKIQFKDADGHVLLEIDPAVGITFKNASGTTTANYPATT